MAIPVCCLDDETLISAVFTHQKFCTYFSSSDFSKATHTDYPELCTLKNENLFTLDHFPDIRDLKPSTIREKYACIEPALLLASRIILTQWESYRSVIRCPELNGVKQELSESEILDTIRGWLPEIKFFRDGRNVSYYVGFFKQPDKNRDLLRLDNTLVRIMRSSSLGHEKKIAAAVFMAVKICSMLATMLEFRSLFDGIVDSTDARHQEGHVYGGEKWETAVLHEISMVIEGEDMGFATIDIQPEKLRGLCVNACPTKLAWMKCDEGWLRGLFSEKRWVDQGLVRPPRQEKFVLEPLVVGRIMSMDLDMMGRSAKRYHLKELAAQFLYLYKEEHLTEEGKGMMKEVLDAGYGKQNGDEQDEYDVECEPGDVHEAGSEVPNHSKAAAAFGRKTK